MPPAESESWSEYRRLVLDHLERHEELIREIENRIDNLISIRAVELEKIRTDIALQKLKNSLLGALSGGIAGGIVLIFQYFKG